MEFLLPLIGFGLGIFLAVRKIKKQKRREKLIDKCLEKYAHEEKNQNKLD